MNTDGEGVVYLFNTFLIFAQSQEPFHERVAKKATERSSFEN
jgi:hypothetical protein